MQQVDANTVMWMLGTGFTVAVATWGTVRYLIGRMDSQAGALTAKIEAEVTALHNRVNGVKDDYVKRVDVDRDLNNLYRLIESIKADNATAMREIREDQHRVMEQINTRLDKLTALVVEHASARRGHADENAS